MEHFNIFRRTVTILAAVLTITSLALTSCGNAGSSDPDKRAIAGFLGPHRVELSPGEGQLYDLTALTEGISGELCAYGLSDAAHLLLLSSETASDGSLAPVFHLDLMDLRDGSLADAGSFRQINSLREEADDGQELEILSADPVLIYDKAQGVLYRPGSDPETVLLPEWLMDSTLCCLGGQLWVSSDRGILYTVREDGTLASVWKLPCEYGAFTPVVYGHDGKLTYTTNLIQDPSERIFVDVDPLSGESSYYRSDLSVSRFTVYSEGLLLGTTFRTDPKVSVCSPSSRSKKEMTLPESIREILSGRTDGASPGEGDFISFSTVPLSLNGDWCTFMLCDEQKQPVRIYLWDTANCVSSRWEGPSETPCDAPSPVDYGELSREAQRLEEQYGVRILMGENIPTEFTDYTAETVTDPSIMEGSLAVLGNVLSLYPEGFFEQLCGDYYRGVALYLTGEMTPLNADSNISNASAFATESNGLMQIAFDLYDDLDPSTVIHELTHAADYRFLGEGLFSEENWNAMNPDGFSYYYSYIDENGESYEYSGSTDYTAEGGVPSEEVYFIDPYSKTFPMEDRARLMENLLSGQSPYAGAFRSGHVQEKLTYYFRFLREILGDGTWPSSTVWETALKEAALGR